MLRYTKLEHRFVHYIPEELEPGVIYVSMEYATAAHSCCCGCGEQVITPFTATDWKLTYDGETISLWPSIGNWNFPCRSHYIIRQSRAVASEPWEEYCKQKNKCEKRAIDRTTESENNVLGLWDRLKRRARRKRK